MKKVLVTGGAGFVGSCLIEELVKDKTLQVYSLDNYFTGKKENHVVGAKYIEGSCVDISQHINFKPDIIYHFGEYSRVSTSFEDIDRVWDSNVVGTHNVLKFCKKTGSKIIYSASSTRFGDNGENINESPYAFSKSQNTDLIKNYHKWFNINYTICYFYNVYGEKQIKAGKYATVIGIFEEQYKNNRPITVVSPGDQARDFTHISDVVNGLVKLIDSGSGDGYCFGTGKSHRIIDVAKMFKKDIQMIDERLGERMRSSIDLSKSKQLGWTSKVDLKEYITKFKENLK